MKQFLFWLFIFVSFPSISHAVVMSGGGFKVFNGQINPILGQTTLGANVVKLGGHPITGVGSGGGISLRQGAIFQLITTTPTPTPSGGGSSSGGCLPGYPCDPRSRIPVELPDVAAVLGGLSANPAVIDRVVAGQVAMPGSVSIPGTGINIMIVDVGLTSVEKDFLRVVTAIGFNEPVGQFEQITLRYQIFDEQGNLLREQEVTIPTDGDLLWAQNLNIAGLDLAGKTPRIDVQVIRGTDSASANADFKFDNLHYLDRVTVDYLFCGRWFNIFTWWGCNWWVPVIILLTLLVIYQRNRISDLWRRKKN